jgi:hypothetical protein
MEAQGKEATVAGILEMAAVEALNEARQTLWSLYERGLLTAGEFFVLDTAASEAAHRRMEA